MKTSKRMEHWSSAVNLVWLGLVMSWAGAAGGQTLYPEVLYSFPLGPAYPYAGVIQGADGSWYGTTYEGGSGYGTVYKVTTNGVMTTLVSFAQTNGARPYFAGLTLGRDGHFYGTTLDGGAGGNGTVFRVTSSGVLTTLASFGWWNGSSPLGELMQASDGSFYGVTHRGGSSGWGTVFQVTTNGVLTSLASFDLANGATPFGGVTLGRDGNLYGTTYEGGITNNQYPDGMGTVFRVTTNGVLTSLVSFTNGNGLHPHAGLTLRGDGNLYGTTQEGGSSRYYGTVFKVTTNGELTTLASFGWTNGAYPYGGLTLGTDGGFYGTTEGGGNLGDGTVFKVTPGGILTPLASFGDTNGRWPFAGLTQGRDGSFYGTTYYGGSSGYGTVFKVTTNGLLGTLASFTNASGAHPQAELVQGKDGSYYGTTSQGGNGGGAGTVFKVTTNGVFKVLATFNETNGAYPQGRLAVGGDWSFYGTTSSGGTGGGTVFRVTTNGVLTRLVSFGWTNGAYPYGGVTLGKDGSFYGTTYSGGNSIYGTVFKVTTNGVLTTLASFNQANGAYPYAGVTQGRDGHLYGTTYYGGATNSQYPDGMGTVFRVTTNGALTSLVSFTNANGLYPYARLELGADGNFYGTTYQGGTSGYGTVFKVTTNGALTTLVSFGYTNGAHPYAGLTLGNDGSLYGTARYGSEYGSGAVFKVTTNGVLTVLGGFDRVHGASPEAGLTLGTDGLWYGTTFDGGGSGAGVIYRLAMPVLITAQPVSRTNKLGSTATFTVSATGTTPIGYQWRHNDTNLVNGTRVSGARSASLRIAGVQAADAGRYSVVVSNRFGSVTSAPPAMLTVVTDLVNPRLTVTRPRAGQLVGDVNFTVAGTVWDNAGIGGIWYRLNGGPWWQAIAGDGTNWLAAVGLNDGTNTLQAWVTDTSGNRSATNTVRFVRAYPLTLLIAGTGLGKVMPYTNGSLLEAGKWYTETATPSSGSAFTNWTGGVPPGSAVLTNKPGLRFRMQPGLVLQASFVDAAKPTVAIASPTSSQQCSNSAFTVRGTARDNGQVQAVYRQLNGGGWELAQGTSNWTANVTLLVGTNTVRAYAVDRGGNVSATNRVTFAYNPFLVVKGSYNGLFSAGSISVIDPTNSGFVTLTLTDRGTFSGKLLLAGTNLAFSGSFNPQFEASLNVARGAKPALMMDLQLAHEASLGWHLTGSVAPTDLAWGSGLEGWRALSGPANPYAGKYTLLVRQGGSIAGAPSGDGAGTITVSGSGAIQMIGTLADGTAISQSTAVSEAGLWPAYASLHGGRGLLLGWLGLDPNHVLASSFCWIEPASTNTAAFAEECAPILARYVVPPAGHNAVNMTNGVVVVEGGNLASGLSSQVKLSNNLFRVTGGTISKLSLTLTVANGLFKGTFVNPVSGKFTALNGALRQNAPETPPGYGGGWWLGPNGEGGLIRIYGQ